MLRKTEAIVLKNHPFSEADLIVTFLTLDYGLVKTFAKGPRKVKSRFGSSLEPLTHAKIAFWGKEDAELPRLTQSDIVRPFQSIRDNLAGFLTVAEVLDLTVNLLPEREPNRRVFALFRDLLSMTEDGLTRSRKERGGDDGFLKSLMLFYKIRFLDITGYAPALDGCARCTRSGRDFYVAHGSILCGDCAQGTEAPFRILPAVRRLYGTLMRWEIGRIMRIKPSSALHAELSSLIDAHLQYTLAKPLKTKALTMK